MFSTNAKLNLSPIEEKTDPVTFSVKTEIIITQFALVATILFVSMVIKEFYQIFTELMITSNWPAVMGHILFIIIAGFLIYGGLVYQFCRLGSLKRRLAHKPATPGELKTFFGNHSPSLTILVPSYKEEERVVFLTLMSAALQDYSDRRVVLLIDDPPNPINLNDIKSLRNIRKLPGKIQNILHGQELKYRNAKADYLKRVKNYGFNSSKEIPFLVRQYHEAAEWFENQAASHKLIDNADSLYVEKTLLKINETLRAQANELRQLYQVFTKNESGNNYDTVIKEYDRLVSLFSVKITCFERKAYENLSHESNKAMNLNSYIGLVGKNFKERIEGKKKFLEEVDFLESDFRVPDTDYFLTLDADSLILPDYSSRLIHFLEQPENARVAVAQTPYSAIPNPSGILERIAGATTDIQYIIHQGFSKYNATYWVGANALLKKPALLDIAEEMEERGHKITRYIQDRTVIEDTESSVDLVDKGWKLHNYPERLAYSATPPDFGSLLIQRRRWANGGLIILPKLLRYLGRGPNRFQKLGEGVMRFHYLTSIAAVNVGLLVILAFPFTENIKSLWLPATALPYFFLYTRDLSLIGYRKSDMARVYALNLLLIPVNLGGVLKSLEQAWTKKKIPFGRTPKVLGRTAVPLVYILTTFALVFHWITQAGLDFNSGRMGHGSFALANTAFLIYAIVQFIGLRETRDDIIEKLPQWRQAPAVEKTLPISTSFARKRLLLNLSNENGQVNMIKMKKTSKAE